jgi:hypothetical protein
MDDTVYVLIFAFDPEGNVLLRQKKHPDWQQELWNGVGGQGNMEDTAARYRDCDAGKGHWPLGRYIAVRKFAEETAVILPLDRLRGNVTVPFPPCILHIFWVHLTAEEAGNCYHVTNDEEMQVVAQELGPEVNRWFDVEDLNDVINGDFGDAQFVSSTYELIQLIRSMWHHFPAEGVAGA